MSMGSITGVGAGFQSALNLKQDILTEYTYATLPTASSNTGLHVWVTDVGINGGSEWRSDGTDWYPINGEVIMYRYGRTRLLCNSGNIVAGSSNTITQTTAWTGSAAGNSPKYIDVYLTAVASTPAITAGWYVVETTGDTTGTILSGDIGSAPITFTVGAAITSVSTRITMHSFTVPAGLMVEKTSLETDTTLRMGGTTNSRSVYTTLGGVTCSSNTYTSATYSSVPHWSNTTTSQGLSNQTTTNSASSGDLSFSDTATTVDMSTAQTYTFDAIKTAAANRVITYDFVVRFRK